MLLPEISDVLLENGYNVKLADDHIVVTFGTNHPMVGVITSANNRISISCQLIDMANIEEDMHGPFSAAMLRLNNAICPYAVCLLCDEDNEESAYFILRDTLMADTLDKEEIIASMEHLRTAIISSIDTINHFTMGTMASA